MPNLAFYVDLLRRTAIRSPTSSAPAPIPDFRNPASYAVSLYFMRPAGVSSENYNYVRYSTGTPQLKLRRIKAPDYSTFTLDFLGYTSPVIDARLPLSSIETLIGSMASVGAGNVHVTGDSINGFTVEFIGDQAGHTQPSFSGAVITPAGGEIVIQQIAGGGNGTNAVQTIRLREAPLAVATAWAEVGVPDTPGWAGTLDTTSVPQDAFDRPDLALEVGLEASNVRTGTDGITLAESSTRSGTDGQVLAGQTDSAVNVQPVLDASAGPDGKPYLVARDGSTVYGRLFTASDIGRNVAETGGAIWLIPAGTTIVDVINQPYYNAAVLSQPFAVTLPPNTIQVDIGGAPTKTFKSATAAFVFADVGHSITGDNIQQGTVIQQLIDAQTVVLSQVGLAAGTALAWTVTALPDTKFRSVTAVFTPGDVGARLESPALPAGVYITAFIDSSNVAVSARPLSVASGQSWTLRPKAGGFGSPSVVTSLAGTLGNHEKQIITFNQQPISGYVAIRDGADMSLPWVQVPAPLSAVGIQSAINAVYVNWQGVTVTELVPNGQYVVEFGVNGQQHLLVVDQSGALFDSLLAQINVGQVSVPTTADAGAAEIVVAAQTHSLARRKIGANYLLGVPATGRWVAAVSVAQVTSTSDGTGSWQIRQRFLTTVNDYTAAIVGQVGFGNYYLDRHDNLEDRGYMRSYDWVGYAQPGQRDEIVQQSKPVMGVARSTLNGRLVDMQLYSYSYSTWVRAHYEYMIGAPNARIPADGPWAILVHFTSIGGFTGITVLLPGWFNSTAAQNITQSWSRRRWHANIFEQVSFIG